MKISVEIIIFLIIFFVLLILTGLCIYFFVTQYNKYQNLTNSTQVTKGYNSPLTSENMNLTCEYGMVIVPNSTDSNIVCLSNSQYEDSTCDPYLYNGNNENYGIANTNFVDITQYMNSHCAGKTSCTVSLSDLSSTYQTHQDSGTSGNMISNICSGNTACPTGSTLYVTGTYSCISKKMYQANQS